MDNQIKDHTNHLTGCISSSLDYKIQTPPKYPSFAKNSWENNLNYIELYNMNRINTNTRFVCKMDNQIKDHTNHLTPIIVF